MVSPATKSVSPQKTAKSLRISLAVIAIIAALGLILQDNLHLAEFFSADITGSQVTLEKTLLQMPGHQYFTGGSTPLVIPFYGDNKFVIVGYCVASNGRRGQFVFSAEGNLIAEQDVCQDSGVGQANGHAWSAGERIQFDGARGFVREMTGTGAIRPALYYATSANSVSYTGRAFTPSSTSGMEDGNTYAVENIAVANGYAVGTRLTKTSGVLSMKNVVYKLPSWQPIREWAQEFTPLTGFGNFVIGYNRSGGTAGTSLYQVNADGQVQFVKVLIPQVAALGYAHDFTTNATNPTKLTLFVPRQTVGGQIRPEQDQFVNLEIRNNSVEVVGTRATPAGSRPLDGMLISFGVAGDYLAVATAGRTMSLSNQAATPMPTWELWKGTQKIATVELPNSRTSNGTEYIGEAIRGLAFAPNGRVLVTNFYGAYLYKIQNFTANAANEAPVTGQTQPPLPVGPQKTTEHTTQTPNLAGTAGSNTQRPDPLLSQCEQIGGLGCSDSVNAGEVQFGAKNANGCSNAFCVACAQGYTWSGGSSGNCEQHILCNDASVGGNGCTFSVRFGEIPLGNPGSYGCNNDRAFCVQCSSGFVWDGYNCVEPTN